MWQGGWLLFFLGYPEVDKETGIKDEILTSHNSLLRTKEWVDEITTSFNQKTFDLLVMTDLEKYFHPHLVPRKWHENQLRKLTSMINQAPTKDCKLLEK